MARCDICSAVLGPNEGTAYALEDLQDLIRRGFGPPDSLVQRALSAGWTREQVVARWRQDLDARPQPYWLLCTPCAHRAAPFLPAPPPAGIAPVVPLPQPAEPLPPVAVEGAAPVPAGPGEPEPVAAVAPAAAPSGEGSGARPGRTFLIGLAIGLLGGLLLGSFVLAQYLRPQPTLVVVATAAPSPRPSATRPYPTNRPATPRPTEVLYPPTMIPVPDLAAATLQADDLPTGFRAMTPDELAALAAPGPPQWHDWGYDQARPMQLTGFSDPRTSESILAFFFYALTEEEQRSWDRGLSPEDGLALVAAVLPGIEFAAPAPLDGFDTLGDRSIGLTVPGAAASPRTDIALVRRGAVIAGVLVQYGEGKVPRTALAEVAGRVDGRLQEVLGVPETTPLPELLGAALRLEDLPSGFVALTPAEMAEMGLSTEDLSSDPDFAALNLANARSANVTVFVDMAPAEPVMVMALLVSPLTVAETASLDQDIAEPRVGEGFWRAMIGREGLAAVRTLEGAGGLADGSAGISAVDTTADPALRVDMVLARRGSVAEVVIAIYAEGRAAPVDVGRLAAVLDQRLAAALGE